MRLIDADTLRKDVEKDRDANDMPKMWYQGVEYAINHIIHAPTVDGVKHGHWIEETMEDEYGKLPSIWHCSECDNLELNYSPYCPYCGARMDEANDEWEEPEINPCRGCIDYDGRGGCKSNGGCGR